MSADKVFVLWLSTHEYPLESIQETFLYSLPSTDSILNEEL